MLFFLLLFTVVLKVILPSLLETVGGRVPIRNFRDFPFLVDPNIRVVPLQDEHQPQISFAKILIYRI
jgi:hypothetical protein